MKRPLRLELVINSYDRGTSLPSRLGGDEPVWDRWTWRLLSGREVVSTSGSQLYSRRVGAARGAEVGAGLEGVREVLSGRRTIAGELGTAYRFTSESSERVPVVIVDARGTDG